MKLKIIADEDSSVTLDIRGFAVVELVFQANQGELPKFKGILHEETVCSNPFPHPIKRY